MTENETLVQNLAVKQREYLKLIEETRENVGILESMNDGDGSLDRNRSDGVEGSSNMRERVHLLTEENHILFE